MNNTLSDIQALGLDELVGGAEDTLPLAIYTAQVQLNQRRSNLRTQEAWLTERQNDALAELYANGEAGKNDRERRINEENAVSGDQKVILGRGYVGDALAAVESAQADLELAQNQFAAVRIRAKVVAAMLEYAASSGKPLHVEAGQSERNDIINDDESGAYISSNRTMHF